MLSIQTILKVVAETPLENFQSGIAAHFLRVSNSWGVKLFYFLRDANKTYAKQQQAFAFGAAPAIGERLEVDMPGEGLHFGYLTECVTDTYLSRFLRQAKFQGRETVGASHPLFMEASKQLRLDASYISLRSKFQDAGLRPSDLHCNNVGWLPHDSDSLVAIDFSAG
jgi:hypothetical protein